MVASIVGAYTLEIAQRRVFAQQRTIAVQKAEIELERAKSDRLLLAILPPSDRPEAARSTPVSSPIGPRKSPSSSPTWSTSPLWPSRYHLRKWSICSTRSSRNSTTPTVELGLEKIKTMGDAYMAAGGLPEPLEDHAVRALRLGFSMLEVVEKEAVKRSLPLGAPRRDPHRHRSWPA